LYFLLIFMFVTICEHFAENRVLYSRDPCAPETFLRLMSICGKLARHRITNHPVNSF
jgi:hypothetical protein